MLRRGIQHRFQLRFQPRIQARAAGGVLVVEVEEIAAFFRVAGKQVGRVEDADAAFVGERLQHVQRPFALGLMQRGKSAEIIA